jgi:hypothetical protein
MSTPSERRRIPRVKTCIQCWVHVIDAAGRIGRAQEGVILDLSRTGVRILANTHAKPGDRILVRRDYPRRPLVHGIIRSRSGEAPHIQIGVELALLADRRRAA